MASVSFFSRSHPRTQGFTLVELLVSVSVFAILVGILGGIYVQFATQQRGQRSQQALQQNIQTFFEILDREVRTGFGTTFQVNVSGTEFSLKNQNLECVKYGMGVNANAGRLVRVISTTSGCDPTTLNLANGVALTTTATDIPRLLFFSVQTPTVDTNNTPERGDDLLMGSQGRVTVSLQVCPRFADTNACADVQTTMTSRQQAAPPS